MQRRRSLIQLRLLSLVLPLFFATIPYEVAKAQSPIPATVPADPAPEIHAPPGMQRVIGKPDTPQERDAMLKRRQELDSTVKIEAVRPLPAQTITPNAAQQQ